jgi:biopolymer transport protein TolQ
MLASSTGFGFYSSILHAGIPEQLVMLVLFLVSIISWGIIIQKGRTLRLAAQQSQDFIDLFWNTKRFDTIFQRAENFKQSPVCHVFRAGYIELAKTKQSKTNTAPIETPHPTDTEIGDLESIARSMRRASAIELTRLERMMPFLATTGSTAPFVGLLGTVLGIISAFMDIGVQGNANLATVAPGIGGALIATAFGLFAAIPAVIAYNFLGARVRELNTEMANFSADFLNIVKRHFF